jgi:hypothetical protein
MILKSGFVKVLRATRDPNPFSEGGKKNQGFARFQGGRGAKKAKV